MALAVTAIASLTALLPYPFQSWFHSDPMPRPTAIRVLESPCPGGYGVACTFPDGTIYWTPGAGLGRGAFFHELGHAFDYEVMNDALRAQFARIFHRPFREWHNGSLDNELAEWFAEGYRLCAQYPRLRSISSVRELLYRYQPTLSQHRHVCALIRYSGNNQTKASQYTSFDVVRETSSV